jgi:hypothetical protein
MSGVKPGIGTSKTASGEIEQLNLQIQNTTPTTCTAFALLEFKSELTFEVHIIKSSRLS